MDRDGGDDIVVDYTQWIHNHSAHLNTYGGDWLKASGHICDSSPVCIDDEHFGQLSWQPVSNLTYFTSQSACDKIKDLKYKRIYFVGDSFIRHIFQAFLLIFTGDYEYGSLNNKQIERCKGNAQFAEKSCSGLNRVTKPYRSVCKDKGDDEIKLGFFDVYNFKATPDKFPFKDPEVLLIWSEGSHPPLFNQTAGGRNVRRTIDYTLYIYVYAKLYHLYIYINVGASCTQYEMNNNRRLS